MCDGKMSAFWNPAILSSIFLAARLSTMPRLLPGEDDTIAALSTASGRSAVAVIRLSGPEAFSIAAQLVVPWPLQPRQATLCRIHDPNDDVLIDQCIVSVFPSPRSYTGEDIVEFSTHGGYAVPAALLTALLKVGAREAQPGEFTRRALLNAKLDLVQVEAIGDLIDATSDTMRRVALHQLDRGLSRQVDELRSALLDLEALLAYEIDFPEEDHGPISRTRVSQVAGGIQRILQELLTTGPATELVRDGAVVTIAGRPNVGKSSLFNAIIGERRAIVTDVPGTTRDAIEARVQLNTWPIRLVDTAGLRATDEPVERLGIEVSERYLANAHVILVCDDDHIELLSTVESIRTLGSAPLVPVLTKVDRLGAVQDDERSESRVQSADPVLAVSAHTRSGLTELLAHLEQVLDAQYGAIPVSRPALTRMRQRVAIERAANELAAFEEQWKMAVLPAPVAAVHIRSAVAALDELIGTVDTEDVLSRLFATFCIGK
jgi:tRNA modification GTPase